MECPNCGYEHVKNIGKKEMYKTKDGSIKHDNEYIYKCKKCKSIIKGKPK